jgi:class 3 adenylate cyclase
MSFLLGLVALAAVGGIAVAWRRWRAERRELARVRGTFARYVAPSVVDVLLARKDERLFTGRAVRATVLVCRIRNFAHFIEPLTPEETLRYLNEFYALAGTAIQRHRGIIDTFLGDGIVAVFGVPLENPTQEDDALQAALNIVRHVVAMRERWEKQHRKPFTVGIGVNTGPMIAGDAGFRDRREFTVVGSEATFAHRLQEAAFALNAFVVASRATCRSLASEYNLVPVNGVPLAGVRRLLDAFVVRGRTQGTERFTVPSDAMIETTIEPATPAPAPGASAASTASGASSPTVPRPASGPVPVQTHAGSAVISGTVATPVKPKAPTAPASAAPAGECEPPVARPRPRVTPASDLGLPDVKHGWMFPQDDAQPILPDPPPPRTTYEDRGGSFDIGPR